MSSLHGKLCKKVVESRSVHQQVVTSSLSAALRGTMLELTTVVCEGGLGQQKHPICHGLRLATNRPVCEFIYLHIVCVCLLRGRELDVIVPCMLLTWRALPASCLKCLQADLMLRQKESLWNFLACKVLISVLIACYASSYPGLAKFCLTMNPMTIPFTLGKLNHAHHQPLVNGLQLHVQVDNNQIRGTGC